MVLTVGDMSLVNAHRHTGTAECPMRFELEVEAEEWGRLVRRIVTKEVFDGPKSLEGLVGGMEMRMDIWPDYARKIED